MLELNCRLIFDNGTERMVSGYCRTIIDWRITFDSLVACYGTESDRELIPVNITCQLSKMPIAEFSEKTFDMVEI